MRTGLFRSRAFVGVFAVVLVIGQSLVANAANIAWVSFHAGDNMPTQAAIDEGYTMAPDVGYTNLLATAGHNVTRFVTVNDVNTNATLIGQLNAAEIDLVMISRSVD